MARSRAKLQPRQNRAFRLAEENDLPGITYTIALSAWSGAAERAAELSARARRVLRWFCALNRGDECGFRGYRGNLALAAWECCKANDGEPCSRATFCRGLAELVSRGYLLRKLWRGGRSREVAPGLWLRDPVAVYVLTDKSLNCWAAGTKPAPRASSSLAPAPAPAPPPLPASAEVREAGADIEESHLRLPVSICDGFACSETLAFCQESRARGAHGTTDEAPASRTSADAGRGGGAGAGAGAGPLDTGQKAAPRGNRKSRASLPRLAPPAGNTPGKRAVLATLASVADHRGRRDGKAALALAAFELADPVARSKSCVRWSYWLSAWPQMTPDERRTCARREILAPLCAFLATPAPLPEARHQITGEQLPEARHQVTGEQLPEARHQVTGDHLVAAMEAAAAAGSDFARYWLQEHTP